MEERFSTIDVTRLTSKEKVLELVGSGSRPGDMCKVLPGFIAEHELPKIAEKLGVSHDELRTNFLREVYAYNTRLHKPKHEANERRLGFKPTDTIHQMPYGKCVFLDGEKTGEHKCMLGDAQPLHCRISTEKSHGQKLHSWYLLTHAVNPDDPKSLREWAIYPKTHPTIPGGELHELVPNKEKLDSILKDDVHTNGGESNGKNDRN